jgi:hypothetical protein
MYVPRRVLVGVVLFVIGAGLALVAGPSIAGMLGGLSLPDPKPYEKETRATVRTPETADIPRKGIAVNFKTVGWNPLLDSDRGQSRDPAFDAYVNPPLNIPRGSNGDITLAGDCVYVRVVRRLPHDPDRRRVPA